MKHSAQVFYTWREGRTSFLPRDVKRSRDDVTLFEQGCRDQIHKHSCTIFRFALIINHNEHVNYFTCIL